MTDPRALPTVVARSVSRGVRALVEGEPRAGIAVGRGYIELDGYVLALTEPGAPRLPNGVECAVRAERGERVSVGGGCVSTTRVRVLPGPEWDPVPRPRVTLRTRLAAPPDPVTLAGRGPGLTPAGDDLLTGYVAGLVLFHDRRGEARRIADAACPLTTTLSATFLRHAANGELPEPAHDLLERGDARALLRWGRSSGRHLLVGLAIACVDPARSAHAGRTREGGAAQYVTA